jgi:sulfur carrier protein ThiS adenylyltransferase
MINDFTDFLQKKLGKEYIRKVQSVKIGIAGCGGLGSNCAFNLVRSGIVKLKLVDFDIVEAANLSRQFFFCNQIGMPKPDALAENLKRINPALELDLVKEKIKAENIADIFKDCRIIVEALDKALEKAMLVERLISEKEFIVSASGIAGFGNSDRIKIHRLKKNLIIVGDLATDISEVPPLSPMINIAAAKQADAVIEYIIANGA